ncbi:MULTISPECIES: hypothetical protein [Aerosakkonema]|uniref:hypothetical protein n=1 Tax=Aerosakkonema TaxID=1246629 RepID=UPI0035B74A8D
MGSKFVVSQLAQQKMYLRWKQRGVKLVWYAYVCAGERRAGKVITRTVGYLGAIAPTAIERSSARAEFWYQVQTNLEKLGMTSEEQEKIVAAIAQKIPVA